MSSQRTIIRGKDINVRHYTVGDRVTQTQYGHGTVSSFNEYHIKIDFDAHGLRTFSTLQVELAPSAIPAPVKVVPTRRRAVRAKA